MDGCFTSVMVVEEDTNTSAIGTDISAMSVGKFHSFNVACAHTELSRKLH